MIWGFANFTVTLLTPIMFSNLKYWLFLVFGATNAFAGWWTWLYCPESGGRTFEKNEDFFKEAAERGRWGVRKVKKGEWLHVPNTEEKNQDNESEPLLSMLTDYVRNM
jgi:Sugar (and other) transporter